MKRTVEFSCSRPTPPRRWQSATGTPSQIREFFEVLSNLWGQQHWWPAESPLEVVIGAYLTQNTAWTNVERAIQNLRSAGALNLPAIRQMPLPELERLVRPAGYFRQKAQRLKTFLAFLDATYEGSLARTFSASTDLLREQLLALNGVGPETADSILLYGGNHPVFVVDAYTRRIVERHGLLPAGSDYEAVRALFESALSHSVLNGRWARGSLPSSARPEATVSAAHSPSAMSLAERPALVQVYNEMHALIVGVGKRYCLKTAPNCAACPLQRFLSRQAATLAPMGGKAEAGDKRSRRAKRQPRGRVTV